MIQVTKSFYTIIEKELIKFIKGEKYELTHFDTSINTITIRLKDNRLCEFNRCDYKDFLTEIKESPS